MATKSATKPVKAARKAAAPTPAPTPPPAMSAPAPAFTPIPSSERPYFGLKGPELRELAAAGDEAAVAEAGYRDSKHVVSPEKAAQRAAYQAMTTEERAAYWASKPKGNKKPKSTRAKSTKPPSAAQLAARQAFGDAAREKSAALKNERTMNSGPVARNIKPASPITA